MHFDAYFDIPFKLRGRDFDGADCYGLVRLVLLHEFNIELPLWEEDYSDIKDHDRLTELIIARQSEFKEVNEPRAGDIVLLRMGSVFPVHIGVMIDSRHFIHTRKDEDVTCCKISDKKWNRRIEGFYRCVK